jgi:uncharacterized protein YggE
MKVKESLFAVIALAGLSMGLYSPAQDTNSQPGTISVSGEAVVKVIPDEVSLTLGIETWHRELSVAKRENDVRVGKVIQLARHYGIESREIQTDFISIEPRYQDPYMRGVIEGYYVRKTIVVTLHDLSQFDPLLSAVTEAGVTHVHGIQFRTTELRKYRDQARTLALQAAKEKAHDMAMVMGIGLGVPMTVHEDHVGWNSWYGYGWWGSNYGFASQNVVQTVGGPAMETDSTLAAGQISVSARVSVTFDLIQQ